jgi:hypothetical protein
MHRSQSVIKDNFCPQSFGFFRLQKSFPYLIRFEAISIDRVHKPFAFCLEGIEMV